MTKKELLQENDELREVLASVRDDIDAVIGSDDELADEDLGDEDSGDEDE